MTNTLAIGVLGSVLAVLLCLGALELMRHRRVIARLPIRIHVNGTRGKTSVVRLIAAGLRAGGFKVCCKTTGSFAALTDPAGTEHPLHRPSQPNIIEQMQVMRRMVAFEPDVVVIECMALQPQYQALTECQMIRSTHGVITNARPDHLDVMGPEPDDVALALAGSTPHKAKLFTAERKYLPVFESACRDRSTRLLPTTCSDVDAINPRSLAGFAYAEHAENVALALSVCSDLGVDQTTSLAGMQQLKPEIGATQVLELDFYGRSIVFVNAFAANDPESTAMIWESVVAHHGAQRTRIAVVNCRFDRPQRSQQLAQIATLWAPADHYVLIGSGTLLFARAAVRYGLSPSSMTVAEGLDTPETFETVLEAAAGDALIVGMCNVHGGGGELARYFSNRAARSQPL